MRYVRNKCKVKSESAQVYIKNTLAKGIWIMIKVPGSILGVGRSWSVIKVERLSYDRYDGTNSYYFLL